MTDYRWPSSGLKQAYKVNNPTIGSVRNSLSGDEVYRDSKPARGLPKFKIGDTVCHIAKCEEGWGHASYKGAVLAVDASPELEEPVYKITAYCCGMCPEICTTSAIESNLFATPEEANAEAGKRNSNFKTRCMG
jgi:hypothetical protein